MEKAGKKLNTLPGRITLHLEKYWAYYLIAAFYAGAGLLFALSGSDVHVGVADNLELFQAQYQMLKNTGTFFTGNAASPFLAGVTRDDLPSEFSLTAFLYMILPSLQAYFAVYFIRIAVAIISFRLLFSEIYGPLQGDSDRSLITMGGFAYGIISVFPSYGICFASIPLIVYLLIRVDRAEGVQKSGFYLVCIFLYPLLSYFSYFGLFILGYLLLAWIGATLRRKKFCLNLFLALIALSAGFIVFENRLFSSMLFSDTVTIRTTMVPSSLDLSTCVSWMFSSLKEGIMHVDGVQGYVVLPVCLIYFVWVNAAAWRLKSKGENVPGGSPEDPFAIDLIMIVLIFNSVIYGIYYYEPFRALVEKLLPPLTGWQFNRTIFFSPFLWYLGFTYALMFLKRKTRYFIRLCAKSGRSPAAGAILPVLNFLPTALMLAAILVIFRMPSTYNDLYATLYARVYEWRTGSRTDDLSYGEFYSEKLFAQVKEDLNYQEGDFTSFKLTAENDEDVLAKVNGTGADWIVCYGFYPGTLEYNGFATLDGYLGFYQQSYKEAFREVIAPALETNESSAAYYDDWGARCYLYSGNGETVVNARRTYELQDKDLHIDPQALKGLGCKYIVSRTELTNADDLGLSLRGIYTEESSPYTVYVYEWKE